VLSNDPTNPLGGLTFTYLLQDASGGAIEALHIDSFAGVTTDVDYVPATGDVPPEFIDRSVTSGSIIDYSFVGPPGELQPGQESELLVVYTNAHVFAASLATVSDGSGAQVASYATPALPGDVNFDGTVNGLDIALVASHWLGTGTLVAGDANFDGVVNGLDISLIASHWLQAAGGGSGPATSVPEPAAVVLAALGMLACLTGPRAVFCRGPHRVTAFL